jgi:hypothetical protein
MDLEPFAALTRRLAATPSRRAAFGALLGAGLAGIAANTDAKKRRKRCKCPNPCPGGRLRLPNGTCAAVCASDDACAATCICPAPLSAEGNRHCAPPLNDCPDVPQTCDTTAECPPGQVCYNVSTCGKRCVPVCG